MASLGFPGIKKQRKNKFYIENNVFFRSFLQFFYDEKVDIFNIFLVFLVRERPGKPREAIRTQGNQKNTTFFRPKN